MSDDPFVGEIMLFGGNFAPQGWFACNGQLLPISQFEALFSLLGTTFGGDGVSTFALPNLSGRTAVGAGNGPGLMPWTAGEQIGTETVTISSQQYLPTHTHAIRVAGTGDAPVPNGRHFASGQPGDYSYATDPPDATMNGGVIGSAGSGAVQPHENMQPFLALTFCICWSGIYPSQN